MAQELEDGEFWLPSDFLTDDDFLTDFDLRTKGNDEFSRRFGSSFGSISDLSSPVESVICSTETDSDEDDFINQLKGWKLSTSPQSTLCAYKPGSNQSSPTSVSRVSSPPPAAKAGEFDETTPFYYPQTPVFTPVKKQVPNTGFYPTRTHVQAHMAYLQLQANQLQQMKRQQMMNRGGWGQGGKSAWPTLQQQSQQQQPGSGMRAVFLGETGLKKERTGTGVFLPRTFEANNNNPTQARSKKPVCSTVLLPERVVHALNLNVESIDAQLQHRGNGNFTPQYDVGLKQRSNNVMMPQHRRSLIPQPVMNQELGFY